MRVDVKSLATVFHKVMIKLHTLKLNKNSLTISDVDRLLTVVELTTVHRDEGPGVVVIKCASFEDTEHLTRLFTDIKQFFKQGTCSDY